MRCREREWSNYRRVKGFKGTQMGPLLVLVCPCSRGNVILTCKIVPFLCSLDNFLLKNVIISFFGNQISKWCSFEKKKAIFDLLFTFFSHQGKHTFLQHISHLHTYAYFAHPIDFFFLFNLTNFAKIMILSCMVSLWCDSLCWLLFAPFWSSQ